MPKLTPQCFLLRKRGTAVQLYISELSTLDGLAVFPNSFPARVVEFGAQLPGGQWLSAQDLSPVHDVASLRRVLLSLPDLTLVDFTAELAGDQLSTHDDGECHFTVRSDEQAIAIVRHLLGPTAPSVIELLLSNRDCYVAIRNGVTQIFHSFDDYLNSGPT